MAKLLACTRRRSESCAICGRGSVSTAWRRAWNRAGLGVGMNGPASRSGRAQAVCHAKPSQLPEIEGPVWGMGRGCCRPKRSTAVGVDCRPSPIPGRTAGSRRKRPFAAAASNWRIETIVNLRREERSVRDVPLRIHALHQTSLLDPLHRLGRTRRKPAAPVALRMGQDKRRRGIGGPL